jgi:hypothetical protein
MAKKYLSTCCACYDNTENLCEFEKKKLRKCHDFCFFGEFRTRTLPPINKNVRIFFSRSEIRTQTQTVWHANRTNGTQYMIHDILMGKCSGSNPIAKKNPFFEAKQIEKKKLRKCHDFCFFGEFRTRTLPPINKNVRIFFSRSEIRTQTQTVWHANRTNGTQYMIHDILMGKCSGSNPIAKKNPKRNVSRQRAVTICNTRNHLFCSLRISFFMSVFLNEKKNPKCHVFCFTSKNPDIEEYKITVKVNLESSDNTLLICSKLHWRF